jgi:ankyrin repeat protein
MYSSLKNLFDRVVCTWMISKGDFSITWPAGAGFLALPLLLSAFLALPSAAQVPPTNTEISNYTELFAAAATGNEKQVTNLIAGGIDLEQRDSHGRTPLHVAAYAGHHGIMRKLVAAGFDPNTLEHDRYDIVTIAAVANDASTLQVSLDLGGNPKNVTSIYEGTALIAAAHLGHVQVVDILIQAGAPLDHVNNLGWTALIESIVLGDGGPAHTATLELLVEAGADVNLVDSQGRTPLQLAIGSGHIEMVKLLKSAGAH